MNQATIEMLKENGKWHPKEDLKSLSKSALPKIERQEENRRGYEFARLDSMYKRGEVDFDSPPDMWCMAFQLWILGRFGLARLVDYLKRHEYKENQKGIPGRLSALGVPKGEIYSALYPPEGEEIKIKVAGVTFGGRQKALERLTHYAPEEIYVVLIPEPENLYDENAIAVKVHVSGTDRSLCIGYIPKTETAKIKPFVARLPELKIIQYSNSYSAELRIAV